MTGEELELLLNTVSGLFDAVVADMDSLFSPLLRAICPCPTGWFWSATGPRGSIAAWPRWSTPSPCWTRATICGCWPKPQVLYTRFGSQARQAQLPRSVPSWAPLTTSAVRTPGGLWRSWPIAPCSAPCWTGKGGGWL